MRGKGELCGLECSAKVLMSKSYLIKDLNDRKELAQ